MNNVHLIVGRRRLEFASLSDAMSSCSARLLIARAGCLLDEEIINIIKILFCLE